MFLPLALLGALASAAPLSLNLTVTDGTKLLNGPLKLPSGGSLTMSSMACALMSACHATKIIWTLPAPARR